MYLNESIDFRQCFCNDSPRFGFSTRRLGHVNFSFAGTTQEAGAGGRSGAAGIPARGSSCYIHDLCFCFNNL